MAGNAELLLPLGEQELAGLRRFESARQVLEAERGNIVAAVDTLGQLLNSNEQDETLVETASGMIGSAGDAAVEVHDLAPLIVQAVGPYSTPEQTVGDQPSNVRHTMDWDKLAETIKSTLAEHPEREAAITEWYLSEGSFINMSPDIGESKKPLIDVTGAANDQCRYRAILGMISLASASFIEEKGLKTTVGSTFQGEDGRVKGWMALGRDEAIVSELRKHVAERIAAGEIEPRIMVTASARTLRSGEAEGKPLELEVVQPHLEAAGIDQPLYSEQQLGFTEGDAFLAGALTVFGGDKTTLRVEDFDALEGEMVPTKIVTLESELGPITVTVVDGKGPHANVPGLLKRTHALKPDVFEDRDGIFGTTTAIYTPGQRMMLRAAAVELGFTDIPMGMFGVSAHASNMNRVLATLIGETNKYVRQSYNLSEIVISESHKFARYGVEQVEALLRGAGGLAVEAETDNP